ncbi:putative peptidoglycan binding protein [Sediminihabitans luteus]|uniref:Putative peptidoglycan binding protein n=1 Tax=Sediminihabitans luteus TaxID=1138585 RepID=A0A2M9CBS9_9CELL|nr:peptidoglycan-binding domain-containing protein [Sediminihabitans luteus]PJJ68542.1 putative peptidoglycan binding protein [Sediminihabitans luteus]GII99877.1 hypothetical protein Slu03_22550 [Sediminihabitans luteus]
MKTSRWVTTTVVCSLAAVGLAFGAATFVDSPWQSAIANSEREPVVTVPVERKTLAADVADVQGKFSAGREVVVPPPALDVPGVVTAKVLDPGDAVSSGTVLAEVSGRPVIALVTPFPLYRDLVPGAEGPDVEALQDALRVLGDYAGTSDGEYGPGTAAAVAALYTRLGYSVPIDPELADAVDDATRALADAQRDASAADLAEGPPDDVLGTAGADDVDEAPSSTGTSSVGASTGSTAVADATRELADARYAALPPLRVSEIARVPAKGVTVLSAAALGTELGGATSAAGQAEQQDVAADPGAGADAGGGDLVRLRVGTPSVTVRVGVASKSAFQAGATVEIRAVRDQDAVVTAQIETVSEYRQPDAETASGLPGYDVTIVLDAKAPFSDGDTLVVASQEAGDTKAEGLAVPLVALREDEAGTFVSVAGRGRVAVTVVATGDGYAVVDAGGLAEDDAVVISGPAPGGGADDR